MALNYGLVKDAAIGDGMDVMNIRVLNQLKKEVKNGSCVQFSEVKVRDFRGKPLLTCTPMTMMREVPTTAIEMPLNDASALANP